MSYRVWVGSLVLYRSRAALGAVVPAMVTVTPDSYVEGAWIEREEYARQRHEFYDHRDDMAHQVAGADGRVWVPSTISRPETGRVHLTVFGPGVPYVEWNVAEGDEPGQWSPVRASGPTAPTWGRSADLEGDQ